MEKGTFYVIYQKNLAKKRLYTLLKDYCKLKNVLPDYI